MGWKQGDIVITMAFDRMGRRVEMRTVKNGAETLQRFVYDNYLCVQQLRGADNALFHSYVWEPIATRPLIFLPAAPSPAYYFHDGNKNVSDLVSLFDSAIHYAYTTFGTSRASALSENPFGFSSEFYNKLLNLSYYNYRHYNSLDGRFNTYDPIGEVAFLVHAEIYFSKESNSVASIREKFGEIFLSYASNKYEFVRNSSPFAYDFCGLNRADCHPPMVWQQSPTGIVPPVDGCSAPRMLPGAPNDPGWFLDVNFTDVCNQHDLCYSDCNTSKQDCDENFRVALLGYCQQRYPTNWLQRNRCNTWARAYFQGVDWGGNEPYNNRQNLNCHCACPKKE